MAVGSGDARRAGLHQENDEPALLQLAGDERGCESVWLHLVHGGSKALPSRMSVEASSHTRGETAAATKSGRRANPTVPRERSSLQSRKSPHHSNLEGQPGKPAHEAVVREAEDPWHRGAGDET